jgi:hypothetical protein
MDGAFDPTDSEPPSTPTLLSLSDDDERLTAVFMDRFKDLTDRPVAGAPPDPNAVIPLYITKRRDTHQARPLCFIGTLNDRTDLLAWARVPPAGYVGEFHRCAKQLPGNSGRCYTYSMQILGFSAANQEERVLLFQLYFMTDLSRFGLYYMGPENAAVLAQYGLGICIRETASKPGSRWLVHFPVSGAINNTMARSRHLCDHPFRRLRGLSKALNGPRSSVNVLLSPQIAIAMAVQARNGMAMEHLGEFLAERARGASVKIFYSELTGTKMVDLGGGKFLYALTLVLPYAIALLMLPPNCAMTDTTFKCVHPYTLAIFHVIVANTSIPIAFGLAPSESAGSYYPHLRPHPRSDRSASPQY